MFMGRVNHTATRLLDGRVLVAGGCGGFDPNSGDCLPLASAELYNPTLGTWSLTGSTSVGRFGFTATLLLDGRVLVAGGGPNGTSAELYNPTTGTWSVTGSPGVVLTGPATRLLDGRVLVTGGGPNHTSAGLYDPTTGTWSATGSSSGFVGAATLLMDGKVLAISGNISAELYDPTTGTWSATGNRLFVGGHPMTLLRDGTVLIVDVGPFSAYAELYDPTTRTWSATGSPAADIFETVYLTTTGLLDGRVLALGGGYFGSTANIFTCNHFSNCVVRSPLVAAVLPTSRSVQVGTPATAFATIINSGTSTATFCEIIPSGSLSQSLFASFTFQTTDPVTNAVTGTPGMPVDIPANAAQSFVFAFTPTDAIPPSDVALNFFCNAQPAPVVSGLNTLLLSASTTPTPDIVALAASADPGIVDIPGANGTGVFAVATVNMGASGSITMTADTGGVNLPVSILLCQTNPQTSACLPPGPAASVTTQINAGDTPTFGVFVTGTGVVPFDPANNRIFFRAKDAGGVTRGSTSVAVRTQ
jgi:hypothetical protein